MFSICFLIYLLFIILYLFIYFFRSFVVKELTAEELEKTERFAKACSDILSSEKKSEEEKLSFGVALDKRNASSVPASLYRTKKISDRQLEFDRTKRFSDRQQLEFERSKRSRLSDSSTRVNEVKYFIRSQVHAVRHKRHAKLKQRRRFRTRTKRDILDSGSEEGNFTNTDDVTDYNSSDEEGDPEQMGIYVPQKTTPKPRAIKPTLLRNITKR